jgi:hypothetical protein
LLTPASFPQKFKKEAQIISEEGYANMELEKSGPAEFNSSKLKEVTDDRRIVPNRRLQHRKFKYAFL